MDKISILYIGNTPEVISHLETYPGFQLTIAQNILVADNFLKQTLIPDVILCEHYVPGTKSGIDYYDQLRENKDYNTVAFILIAHEFSKELYWKAFEKRIDDFYVLPLPDSSGLFDRFQFLKDFHRKYAFEKPVFIQDVQYRMPRSKRLFDLLVSISALICLSPILLIVMLAIRLESKGKVYYTSKRVGRKTFDFYKLRSMRTGADKELDKLAKEKNQYTTTQPRVQVDFMAPCQAEACLKLPENERCQTKIYIGSHAICENWYKEQKKKIAGSAFVKIANDPRITKVGKFIRNTSIDELPQLINVVKGDMSIVGNRPLPVYEAELLTRGEMAKRFLAPAGITGLWQVELRGKGGVMSEDERKRLDNEYADHFSGDNYSFWYDFKLVLRTFKALFQKDSV